MSARARCEDRCPQCRMRCLLCLCPIIPRVVVQTRLIVIMHHKETRLTTNTARLALLALPNSELRLRGDKVQPMSDQGLIKAGHEPLLLYPSDDAVELTPAFAAQLNRPAALIVPDGSWRQASKVASRVPALTGVTRVKLVPGRPTEYRLRRETKQDGLATFEAIARALGVLEGPAVQTELEAVFRAMVERTLWSRGWLSTRECTTGIPPEAIQEAKHSGTLRRSVTHES